MQAIQPILQACDEGYAVMLLHGRSLHDLAVDTSDPTTPHILTIDEGLRRHLRARYGMLRMTFDLAGGFDWDEARIDDERDRGRAHGILQTHHLLNIPQDDHEVARYIRGFSSLLRAPTRGLQWANGDPMRFALIMDFAEHPLPSISNGTQTEAQMIASEGVHLLAQSMAMRESGNILLLHGRPGQIDDLITRSVYQVHLLQPDAAEKQQFVEIARRLYTDAHLSDDLTWEQVANITSSTPNRGVEAQLRASHRTHRSISSSDLVAQKNRDVQELSEGTLTILDTSGVEGVELVGLNVETPAKMLTLYADRLAIGDRNTPANFLLAGAPGTGKTDLARLVARRAGVAAFALHSPKSPWVGVTERLARLQARVLRESAPNVAFTDEITEALPLGRDGLDTDSGASKAVTAVLLAELSDDSRRGKNILLGATNRPWDISTAMISRFVVVPVLSPLRRDLPRIVATLARRVSGNADLEIDQDCLEEASDIFAAKSASPRRIVASLNQAIIERGQLTGDTVRYAARNFAPSTDGASSIFADLWAVKLNSHMSLLPWYSDPGSYPYPPYLQSIVDPRDGSINTGELDNAIERYRPHAHV